jgi:hypothetical protein
MISNPLLGLRNRLRTINDQHLIQEDVEEGGKHGGKQPTTIILVRDSLSIVQAVFHAPPTNSNTNNLPPHYIIFNKNNIVFICFLIGKLLDFQHPSGKMTMTRFECPSKQRFLLHLFFDPFYTSSQSLHTALSTYQRIAMMVYIALAA